MPHQEIELARDWVATATLMHSATGREKIDSGRKRGRELWEKLQQAVMEVRRWRVRREDDRPWSRDTQRLSFKGRRQPGSKKLTG